MSIWNLFKTSVAHCRLPLWLISSHPGQPPPVPEYPSLCLVLPTFSAVSFLPFSTFSNIPHFLRLLKFCHQFPYGISTATQNLFLILCFHCFIFIINDMVYSLTGICSSYNLCLSQLIADPLMTGIYQVYLSVPSTWQDAFNSRCSITVDEFTFVLGTLQQLSLNPWQQDLLFLVLMNQDLKPHLSSGS